MVETLSIGRAAFDARGAAKFHCKSRPPIDNGAMLDAFKNLGSLPGLMAKAQEMQKKMAAYQAELGEKQFTSDAGGGAVTAVVNGRFELVKVRIDRSKLDPNDTELLEDVIVAAVAAAQAKAAASVQGEMARMTSEMGLPPGMIPGM